MRGKLDYEGEEKAWPGARLGFCPGLAHIGVIQVLIEQGIEIDVVAGSSMGGIVGGLYAAGLDMYFLEKYAEKFAIKKYLDFSLRDGGLVRGKRQSSSSAC